MQDIKILPTCTAKTRAKNLIADAEGDASNEESGDEFDPEGLIE